MADVLGIIGLGRMGQVLAGKLAPYYTLLVHDRHEDKTHGVAVSTGAMITDLRGVTEAQVIIMALPTEAITKIVCELLPCLRVTHILVNIATNMPRKRIEDVLKGQCPVISAKIIGQATEIIKGEIPKVVIDAPNQLLGERVANIFRHLGTVVFDQEDIVQRLNKLAASEGVKAALSIRMKMQEEGIPSHYYTPAVRGVAAGTMKAFASGEAGPFAYEIINEMCLDERKFREPV